jgi:hypothetical protein
MAVAAGLSTPARADLARVSEQERWSVGMMVGAPTGLVAKRYLGGPDAIDIGLSGFLGPGIRVHGDYLWGLAHLPSDSPNVALNLYLGAGPMLGVLSGTCGLISGDRCGRGLVYAGARVPFGIEAVFRKTPLAIGFELAPGLAATADGLGGTFDLLLVARFLL